MCFFLETTGIYTQKIKNPFFKNLESDCFVIILFSLHLNSSLQICEKLMIKHVFLLNTELSCSNYEV